MRRSLIPILLEMRTWGVEYEKILGGDAKFQEDGYERPNMAAGECG